MGSFDGDGSTIFIQGCDDMVLHMIHALEGTFPLISVIVPFVVIVRHQIRVYFEILIYCWLFHIYDFLINEVLN